jgi:16S rRNA (guanine(966)-N(2))-methyltransferase RsmD
LFNILGPGIRGERVLDLFAGTGAVGIEALSRGAAAATFVEQGREALADIRENVRTLGFTEQADVVATDVFAFLRRTRERFDVIFAGPPQWNDLWSTTLQAIDQRDEVLADGGLLVTQLDPTEDTGDPELASLLRVDERTYGRTRLLLHERPP